MKYLAVLLGLACAVSTVLARDRVVFEDGTPANETEPLVKSRHFRRATKKPNWRSSQYSDGNVDWDTDKGVIYHESGIPHDITTISTFYIPAEATSHTCRVVLELDPTSVVIPTGSKFIVYLLQNVPTMDMAWNQAAERVSPPLGVMTAVQGLSSVGPAVTFNCDLYAGSWIALEFAPFDGIQPVNIQWDDVKTGPVIKITP